MSAHEAAVEAMAAGVHAALCEPEFKCYCAEAVPAALAALVRSEAVRAALVGAMTGALEDRIVPGACDCGECGAALANAILAALAREFGGLE